MKPLRILNLYAGIGGNRKLWEDVEITAVEFNPEIAAIYAEYFPHDTVIVGDAHQYLLDHYRDYDFIWSSRPCQSHSRARMWTSKGGRYAPVYPDMALYQEIIFMQHFCDCPWVMENVVPYYEPLIKPTARIDRHLFWASFRIDNVEAKGANVWALKPMDETYGFSMKGRKIQHRKDQILRNCVNPELGLHILDTVRGIQREKSVKPQSLFSP